MSIFWMRTSCFIASFVSVFEAVRSFGVVGDDNLLIARGRRIDDVARPPCLLMHPNQRQNQKPTCKMSRKLMLRAKSSDVSTNPISTTRLVKANTEPLIATTESDTKQSATPTIETKQSQHWKLDTDPFLADFTHNTTDNTRFLTRIRFDIRGNPLPLRRHRSSRGFMYNPSAGAQESFRETVQSIVSDNLYLANADDASHKYPLFASHHVLRMTLIFYLKRPKSHFTAGRPGHGRLRESAPKPLSITKKDVDNLAKFVLDSLNEIAYADDHQIVSLHVTKLLDDEGECLGKTRVQFEIMKEDDLAAI